VKNTISFLKKIKKNNNTPWMHAHKGEYIAAKEEFAFLVQELIVRISAWDSRLPHLEVKDCVFRFNRDTRFSDNKILIKKILGPSLLTEERRGDCQDTTSIFRQKRSLWPVEYGCLKPISF
jgi:uncharacterized protein (TIGR02453 family)